MPLPHGSATFQTPGWLARACVALGTALFAVVLLKTAWVAEDAYINFRSVEQLFAGRGPRWNPHERVQVFTSPLWYGALAAVRLVTTDLFLGTLALCGALSAATLWVFRRLAPSPDRWLVLVVALSSANAFVDFSTSGLEGSLIHLLVAAFCWRFLLERGDSPEQHARRLDECAALAGLALLTRHDLATLLALPGLACAWWAGRSAFRRDGARGAARVLVRGGSIALGPLLVWSVVALAYYGSPFPNTAYAKLNTGIEPAQLMGKGARYVASHALFDPVTLLMIAAGLALGLAQRGPAAWLAAGIGLNLLYVVRVGGDYMFGRFLTPALVVAACLLVAPLPPGRWPRALRMPPWVLVAGLLAYNGLHPRTPIREDGVVGRRYGLGDVSDFRQNAKNASSLNVFVQNDRAHFPYSLFHIIGDREGRRGGIYQYSAIGIAGYTAGIDLIIVDGAGLADPLLARLPMCPPGVALDPRAWRVGHYYRCVPDGYLASLRTGQNRIADPAVAALYDDVRLATQDRDLWSPERWGAIWRLNTARRRGITAGGEP